MHSKTRRAVEIWRHSRLIHSADHMPMPAAACAFHELLRLDAVIRNLLESSFVHVEDLRARHSWFVRNWELIAVNSSGGFIEALVTIDVLLTEDTGLRRRVRPDIVLGVPRNMAQLLVTVDWDGAEGEMLSAAEAQTTHCFVNLLVKNFTELKHKNDPSMRMDVRTFLFKIRGNPFIMVDGVMVHGIDYTFLAISAVSELLY